MATKTGTPPHGNGDALLTAGFASIGKDRGDREGQRLSQESVENFIRRASRCIAQRCSLSQREEEILRYLARGYSYTYTAQDFCISENAVAAPNGSCVSPRRAPGHRARPYAQPGLHPAPGQGAICHPPSVVRPSATSPKKGRPALGAPPNSRPPRPPVSSRPPF